MANKNHKFGDLEDAFGLPAGSTKMTASRIRQTETEIIRKTKEVGSHTDAIANGDVELVEKSMSVALPPGNNGNAVDLVKDTPDVDLAYRVRRGKEFCRLEALEMYTTCKEATEMLKTELMPGSPASMWMAYSNLVKTLLECKKEIGSIYTQLEEELKFMAIPDDIDPDKKDNVAVSIDKLMELAQTAVKSKDSMEVGKIIEVAGEVDVDDN